METIRTQACSFVDALKLNGLNMRNITLLLMMMLVKSMCYGAIFSHIDSATLEEDGKLYYDYTIDAWDYEDKTINPCFGVPKCTVGVSHRHSSAGEGGIAVGMGWGPAWSGKYGGGGAAENCIVSSVFVGQLGKCLRDTPSDIGGGMKLTIPFKGPKLSHKGATVRQECVGVFYKFADSDLDGATMLPGSVCGVAPPPSGACAMAESVELDHHTLVPSELDGNTVSETFLIDCNMPLDAKLYINIPPEGLLPLGDSGIKSEIKINNQVASSVVGIAVHLNEGQTNIDISSTLSVAGNVSAGKHVGQAVVVIAME